MHDNLLPIGRLAKAANISVDTLRYYDDIGLVTPIYISDESGYRYYAEVQAEQLEKIKELKSYGFSLRDIKKVLLMDEHTLHELYLKRYYELIKEREKLQETIDKLSEKIRTQQEELS